MEPMPFLAVGAFLPAVKCVSFHFPFSSMALFRKDPRPQRQAVLAKSIKVNDCKSLIEPSYSVLISTDIGTDDEYENLVDECKWPQIHHNCTDDTIPHSSSPVSEREERGDARS
jgi:hypothetical protein